MKSIQLKILYTRKNYSATGIIFHKNLQKGLFRKYLSSARMFSVKISSHFFTINMREFLGKISVVDWFSAENLNHLPHLLQKMYKNVEKLLGLHIKLFLNYNTKTLLKFLYYTYDFVRCLMSHFLFWI